MKRFLLVASLFFVSLPAQWADAHGTPILVGAAGQTLVVSGGLSDELGFASQIFVEDDEDGDPFASLLLPNLGPVILWQIPGLNISGLNEQSSLSIEVLARPVKCSNPVEERILWYWNPQTELVEPATSDYYLLGTGSRYQTLSADGIVAPPPFLLASSLAGQQGYHNHGLLSYALDNNPAAAHGAYGFFARLKSNLYEPSNPFLIVFNYGVDYSQMVSAALAINEAASGMLAGDYNHDQVVDAADFVSWRKTLDTLPDYQLWHGNFGAMTSCNLGATAATAVPEPATITKALACVGLYVLSRQKRRRAQAEQEVSIVRSNGTI
jgi:hypothetical protein